MPAFSSDWFVWKGEQAASNDVIYSVLLFTILSTVVISSFMYRYLREPVSDGHLACPDRVNLSQCACIGCELLEVYKLIVS